ncbi:hypothetical protein QBL02_06695 [Leucobacter sp. UT-8R-CII-1-4]|uniref:hypothetical protein n=1 Tax=Leucobacter sp. UT-8R-CII-1-4 TaxID=3040075 RepID=UPI0024A81EC1|nr:hypothetical protein [Leucobacter sp. UT-8R-CII-1-4]MDI6023230.1 hypothetical protein [Leucobacter sp. UT-8R-CII-1-4]
MEILRNVLVVLHIIGFAGILAGVMMQMPKVKEGAAKINGAILHSSLLMLVTGLGLVGMMYARDLEPNNMKIGVKTLVLIVMLVLALVNKKKQSVSPAVLGSIGGLAVLNVILAVFWH